MNLLVLDFETYFDQDFSLSKMTTESYVRDARFRAHLVGTLGVSGFPSSLPRWIAGVEDYLRLIDWSNTAVIAHHAHFDGLILAHHYGIRPAFWFDTLSMARLVLPRAKSHSLGALARHFGLAEKTVPYEAFKGRQSLPHDLQAQLGDACYHDCALTYEIWRKLMPHVPREELRVIDQTVRMFTEPVLRLDRPRVEAFLASERERKVALLDVAGVTASDMQSSARFKDALEGLGYQCPMKPSPTGAGMIPALAKTDPAMTDMLEHEDPTVAALAAARLGVKSTIDETRAERLLGMDERGALPVYLTYCGAHTTRWSGGDKLNWQNLPRGGELRRSVMAPPGHQIVVGDLSQIEYRVNCRLAGQWDALDDLASGVDRYCVQAGVIYGRPITKEDKRERQHGKVTVLAGGYGMGPGRYGDVCRIQGITLAPGDAERSIAAFRALHASIAAYWRTLDNLLPVIAGGATWESPGVPFAISGHRVIGPNGTALDYTGLTRGADGWEVPTKRGMVKIYGAKLLENIVQWLSRIILSQAALRITARTGHRMALTVHDELVYVVPDAEVAQFRLDVDQELTRCPDWWDRLPLAAEILSGVRYEK